MTFAISDSFLSTPSARRATEGSEGNYKYYIFLSTPSARRATGTVRVHLPGLQISIHALREEGDLSLSEARDQVRLISIHALREEGDSYFLRSSSI